MNFVVYYSENRMLRNKIKFTLDKVYLIPASYPMRGHVVA
jgi:hypothetical protein